MAEKVKLVECPRDAMQGIKPWIPTEVKAAYINQVLKAGFNTVDFGSFVSEKAMPQMKDSAEVLKRLDLTVTDSKLLAIVANMRGAEDAVAFDEISVLGFPFSISETFQQRNTNSSIETSLVRVEEISSLCSRKGKELVIYISMGFGNPYGDVWNPGMVVRWCNILHQKAGIKKIALSDTVGVAVPETISALFKEMIPELPGVEFGAHLHTTPATWEEKVRSAFDAGCRSFDGAIKGYGGCPMAADDLTGNMPTENMISFFDSIHTEHGIHHDEFNKAVLMATEIFPVHS